MLREMTMSVWSQVNTVAAPMRDLHRQGTFFDASRGTKGRHILQHQPALLQIISHHAAFEIGLHEAGDPRKKGKSTQRHFDRIISHVDLRSQRCFFCRSSNECTADRIYCLRPVGSRFPKTSVRLWSELVAIVGFERDACHFL